MNKGLSVLAVISILLSSGRTASAQQYPVMDRIADKVVQK